jgi:predicted DCC family thiol-disulfide oxidoreductase YuxK
MQEVCKEFARFQECYYTGVCRVCKEYARGLQDFAHSEEYANVSVQSRIGATKKDTQL